MFLSGNISSTACHSHQKRLHIPDRILADDVDPLAASRIYHIGIEVHQPVFLRRIPDRIFLD